MNKQFMERWHFQLVLCGLLLLAGTALQAEPKVDRLISWLGITDAAQQADRAVDQQLRQLQATLSNGSLSFEQQQQIRPRLIAATGSEALTLAVSDYVTQHLPESSANAETLLAEPVAVRVRNFDVAMEMAKGFEKYQAFVKQIQSSPVSEQRLALIKRLDKARRTSKIAALLQTEIEISTHALVASMTDNQQPLLVALLRDSRQRQRQQQLAEVVNNLNLFSYRYMQDEELLQLVELLESPALQELIAVCEQGLRHSLQASRAALLQEP